MVQFFIELIEIYLNVQPPLTVVNGGIAYLRSRTIALLALTATLLYCKIEYCLKKFFHLSTESIYLC